MEKYEMEKYVLDKKKRLNWKDFGTRVSNFPPEFFLAEIKIHGKD